MFYTFYTKFIYLHLQILTHTYIFNVNNEIFKYSNIRKCKFYTIFVNDVKYPISILMYMYEYEKKGKNNKNQKKGWHEQHEHHKSKYNIQMSYNKLLIQTKYK